MYCAAQALLAEVCIHTRWSGVSAAIWHVCECGQGAACHKQHDVYRYKASQQVLEHAEDFCAQATSSATAMSPCRECHEHPCIWSCHVLATDHALQCSDTEEPSIFASSGHKADGKQAAAKVSLCSTLQLGLPQAPNVQDTTQISAKCEPAQPDSQCHGVTALRNQHPSHCANRQKHPLYPQIGTSCTKPVSKQARGLHAVTNIVTAASGSPSPLHLASTRKALLTLLCLCLSVLYHVPFLLLHPCWRTTNPEAQYVQ